VADNVAITAGAGTSVATDDIGSVHYQRVKTTLGPDGTATADLAGVDLGSGAGAAYVRPRPDFNSQTQTSSGLTTASTAYSALDTIGAGWTFTSMALAAGGGGRILGVAATDEADILETILLWFFSASITFGTDNSLPSISDTDVLKFLGVVPLGFSDLGGCRAGSVDSINVPYVCDATSLFVYATTQTAHTFFAATDDIVLRLFYTRDS
jgi:hypothetical protein